MRACLIITPKIRYNESILQSDKVDIAIPIGVLSIAAMLEKHGHEVKIIDCLVSNNARVTRIDDKKIMYGMPFEEMQKHLNEFNPDVIGVANLFSAQKESLIETIKRTREVCPVSLIITGGPHITVRPEEFLNEVPEVDVCVLGEGEWVFSDLMLYKANKKSLEDIKGIAYRKGNGVVKQRNEFIGDLDEIPFPAYHLIDMESYFNLGKKGIFSRGRNNLQRTVSTITSRGCPYNCNFCSIHLHMGKPFRYNSPKYVLDHIKLLIDRYKIEEVLFEDDNLTLNKKRFNEILDGIINNNIKIKWSTPNGVRADTLTRELVRKCKKTGCSSLTIAPESGKQETLDKIIDKALDLKDVIKAAKICKEEKLPLYAFFIIGFPGETKADMLQTVRFAKMLRDRYGVIINGAFQATPLVGTRLYNEAKEKGYVVMEPNPENLAKATQVGGMGLIKTPEFTPEDVYKINQELIVGNYIKTIKSPTQIVKKIYYFIFFRSFKSKVIILKRIVTLAKTNIANALF